MASGEYSRRRLVDQFCHADPHLPRCNWAFSLMRETEWPLHISPLKGQSWILNRSMSAGITPRHKRNPRRPSCLASGGSMAARTEPLEKAVFSLRQHRVVHKFRDSWYLQSGEVFRYMVWEPDQTTAPWVSAGAFGFYAANTWISCIRYKVAYIEAICQEGILRLGWGPRAGFSM